MKTELELLGSRMLLAVTLRRSGMTYRKIGERIGGVGNKRASQIVARGERMLRDREEGRDEVELNCRAANCLSNAGIGHSRKSVREAIESGILHPNNSPSCSMTAMAGLNPEYLESDDVDAEPHALSERVIGFERPYRLRNYGWKTHKILCEYAGIPYHREEERLKRLRGEVARLEKAIERLEKAKRTALIARGDGSLA